MAVLDPQATTPAPSIFDPSRLLAVVQQTMAATPIPEGHRGALFAAVNEQGVSFNVETKLDESGNWTLSGSVEHGWDDNFGARLELKGTF